MDTGKFAVPTPLQRGEQFTFSALADAVMASYAGRDPTFASKLHFFTQHLGDLIASEIDADHVVDCLDALRRRGKLHYRAGTKRGGEGEPTHKPLADATINRYRCTLQSVLTWARKKRLMPKGWINPVNETERIPEDNMRKRYLKPDEYERLLKMTRISQWRKLTAIVMLAVTTGARRGTLLGLKWKDVDLDRGEAFVQRTKNGEPFVLVLTHDVVTELKKFRNKGNADEYVFCGDNPFKPANFNKSWDQALRDARLENTSETPKNERLVFHSLRHTHASWLAQQGAPLLAIADSMGHKSLAMTKRYSHLCIDSRKEMICKTFSGNQATN
jgi:integrase